MTRIRKRIRRGKPRSTSADAERRYAEFRAEVYKRELSNSENFDKAILTYASGALAVSLAFLKDFVPIHKAASVWLLYVSWGMFVCCIVSTVASYLFSQAGIKRQLSYAKRYYVDGDRAAFNAKNVPARVTEWLNIASGALFCCAIITTTVFIAVNAKAASLPGKMVGAQGKEASSVTMQVAYIATTAQTKSVERAAPMPARRPIRATVPLCTSRHAVEPHLVPQRYNDGVAAGACVESTGEILMNGKMTVSTDGMPVPDLIQAASGKDRVEKGAPVPHIIPAPAPPQPPPPSPPPPPPKR